MAYAHEFEGANIRAVAPTGFEEMIGTLYCFHNGHACVSAWKPDAAMLEKLNAGESIFISVMTGSTKEGRPIISPVYVGTEDDCLEVVSDTGKVWK